MTVLPPTETALAARRETYLSTNRTFDLTDGLSLAILYLLFAALVLPYDRLPMQMADESRNALNALNIDLHGHWLVPYYAGQPDHWNTKPPLLIWMIAGWLRLGLPPLLALRITSLLATAGTITLVWWFCRYVLRDRLAAFLAGLLILTSSLYIGPHMARSGDYDALLCALMTGQALALWLALEPVDRVRIRPFTVWAACLVGAVMTKSTAGALLLPGFLLFALLNRRLLLSLRNGRVWLITLAAIAVCAGYYVSRDLYDPGYLHAVWQNDMGGRFNQAQEHDGGSALYYVVDLLRRFEPGTLLLPLAVFPLLGEDARRRSMVGFCLLVSLVQFLVISAAATKLEWYAAPIIPLLGIAGGIGIADALTWLSRDRGVFRIKLGRLARPAVFVLLACAAVLSVMRNQVWAVRGLRTPDNDQFWYGAFLKQLHDNGLHDVTVLDNGLPNHAAFIDYNPMLRFYAAWEDHRGLQVTLRRPGVPFPVGTKVASCDRASLMWLQVEEQYDIQRRDHACAFGQIVALHPTGSSG